MKWVASATLIIGSWALFWATSYSFYCVLQASLKMCTSLVVLLKSQNKGIIDQHIIELETFKTDSELTRIKI